VRPRSCAGSAFAELDLDRPLETFSGGELTRASLARALGGDPTCCCSTSRPTTSTSRAWSGSSRSCSRSTPGSCSSRTTAGSSKRSRTACSSSAADARSLRRPLARWRIEKAARASAAGKTADRLGVDIERLERFVERFRYKKSKAKQAQAKLTQIGRLERERKQASGELESLTMRQKRLGFDFLDPPRSGRTVIETKGLEVSAGTKSCCTASASR
jgi:ATP-binding cassette subfamily F protein 3